MVGCAHDVLSTGVWVHELRIEGARSVPRSDLEDALATQKTGWWPFATKQWFDEAAFDLDLQRIKAFYADRGFFDARVLRHQVENVGGRKDRVDVSITVDEGPPTQIVSVTCSGFPTAEEQRARKEAAAWGLVPGRRFDYAAYVTVEERLRERLKRAGYAYGNVEGRVEVERDAHTAAITFESRPGPLVRLGETRIDGNDGIPTWKLLNRVTWKKGDLYDPGDLETTQGRLYDFGVFSSVRVDLPPEPTDVADVAVHVKPGPLHELRAGAGVGAERIRDEVRARVEWTVSNFLGGLRRLRFRTKPAWVVIPSVSNPQRSGPAAENDVQLTQPDMFGSRVTGHAVAGYDLGIEEGYRFYGPRAELGVERPFLRDRLLLGAAWNLRYLDFFDVDVDVFGGASSRFFGFVNPYRLAYMDAFGQLDLRDRPLDPRLGTYVSLHLEAGDAALGGAFRYLKLTPELRAYAPLGHRVVFAARALVGWLMTFGDDTSPITRRYRLGGPSSHRGFGFGRLSPQARGVDGTLIPYGGDGELLLSGDVRIDATKLGGNWLDVVPFVDAGDVTPGFAQLDVLRLHVATGVSLEYTTPIGIVRGGVGVRVNRVGGNNPDPDSRYAFHITLGEAF